MGRLLIAARPPIARKSVVWASHKHPPTQPGNALSQKLDQKKHLDTQRNNRENYLSDLRHEVTLFPVKRVLNVTKAENSCIIRTVQPEILSTLHHFVRRAERLR